MIFLIFLLNFFSPSYAVPLPEVTPALKGGKKTNKADAVLIISNESYQKFPQVVYATKDGDVMKDIFTKTMRIHKRRVYSINNAKLKYLKKYLKRAIKRVRKGTLWIYYSGHGLVLKSGERAILANDATDATLEEYSISFNEIFEMAKKNKRIKRVVIIADANFGTKGRDNLKVFKRSQLGIATPLPYSNPNQIVWIPSEDQQPSPHFPIAQQGMFSYLIAGAFRGWADGELDGERDGTLTFGEMQYYVRHKMVALGVPIKPSVFTAPEVEDIVIHSLKMEESPDHKIIHELSKDFLSRYLEDAAEYLRSRANNDWQITLQDVKKGGSDGEAALKLFLKEYEYATIPMKWSVYIPQVVKARQMLQNYVRKGNVGTFSIEDCNDESKINATARKGELSKAQISCLESQIRLQRTQTTRSRLSRTLIVNAQVKKDMKTWEKLMRRHLEEYDRSDPTMNLTFAIYLSQQGETHYKEALKWCNNANENRMMWEGGDDYIQKTNKLLKLRATLATEIWIIAEDQRRLERTPEKEENADNARADAKLCAREWLDYCRAVPDQLDSRKAFDMCVSAAGNADLCRE